MLQSHWIFRLIRLPRRQQITFFSIILKDGNNIGWNTETTYKWRGSGERDGDYVTWRAKSRVSHPTFFASGPFFKSFIQQCRVWYAFDTSMPSYIRHISPDVLDGKDVFSGATKTWFVLLAATGKLRQRRPEVSSGTEQTLFNII